MRSGPGSHKVLKFILMTDIRLVGQPCPSTTRKQKRKGLTMTVGSRVNLTLNNNWPLGVT